MNQRRRGMIKPMTAILAIATALMGGCASYTQTKIDLTAQAQHGVSRVRDAVASIEQDRADQDDALRARLDSAFDEDVLGRGELALTPDWVIAHRKAHAAAVDAFEARHQLQSEEAQAVLATLDAVGLALDQLQQMHAAEMRLTLPEVKR